MIMKKLILLFAALMFSILMYSQKIEVKENSVKFGKETKNALSTTVYYSDIKTVEKEIDKLIKSYKGKASKKKGIILGDNLVIPTLSANVVDVYFSAIKQKTGEIEVNAAFDLGGAYLSSSMHPDQFKRAKDIIKEFAFGITEKGFAEIVKNEENKLKDAEKDFEKLNSKKQSLLDENEDLKSTISKNEKEIEKLTKQMEEQESALKEMKKNFEKMKSEGKKINK